MSIPEAVRMIAARDTWESAPTATRVGAEARPDKPSEKSGLERAENKLC
jgi:hypothetical protein